MQLNVIPGQEVLQNEVNYLTPVSEYTRQIEDIALL